VFINLAACAFELTAMPTQIAINGAAGRMGRRLVALASQDKELRIVDCIERPNHAEMGHDAGLLAGVKAIGVAISPTLSGSVQAVIDFSVPAAADAITAECVGNGVPLVMATTGLSVEQQQRVRQAAETIPVVWAPNMSLAVNLALKLAEIAGKALKDYPGGADVEIIDRHHRFKEDAPSGTALKFGERIAAVMGQTKHVHGRHGQTGQRGRDEIGYHALRVGDNPGEHTIVFALLGESIELTVRASSRDCYALGALAAAKFIARQKPGLYSMSDVLGM
jgi:4-hydroxy-tetrahydrodipicolinate reductase